MTTIHVTSRAVAGIGRKYSGISFPLAAYLIIAALTAGTIRAEDKPDNAGLIVTVAVSGAEAGRDTDSFVAPNLKWYVPAGKPVTPFVSPGKFQAIWTGALTMDLRSDYAFRAEVNGGIKLEINGKTVLEGQSNGGIVPHSPATRLNKGANVLKLTYSSPDSGDAFVRLYWTDQPDKDATYDFIPDASLTHETATPGLTKAMTLRTGRELVLANRCLKCHDAGLGAKGIPDIAMDAPSFDGIGSRRRAEWMARWVEDPHALRPTAHMPKVLHGATAKDEAASIAAYLGSLKDGTESTPAPTGDVEAGQKLVTVLNCAGCHVLPDATEADATKIPLKLVGQKFTPASLAAFLRDPAAHYTWSPMPNFKFSADEAGQISVYLLSVADKPADAVAKASDEIIATGRKLVQTKGCLSCHGLKEDNKFSTKKLAEFAHFDQGCLAAAPKDDSSAPQYTLSDEARAAISAFLQNSTASYSLQTDVPTEFAERQTRRLNCRACHGQLEGFPALELVGGKLKPEWMKTFIGGELPYKPRPWMPVRMPAFKAPASELAVGLVMMHGTPPVSPQEPAVNTDLAESGRKLISANGGFSCVLCHAVNNTPATQVFESEGINLGRSGARLQPAYFYRWLRNPPSIDPQTKMPKFFTDDLKSPLGDVLDGDVQKQLDAIWNYIRLGEKMVPPPGPDGK